MDLNSVLELHKKWLNNEPNGVRADLSGANLQRATLCGANLSEVDLSMADLSWANLSEVDLSMADLSWANLSGADLSGANLSEAYLRNVNLNEADLTGANLKNANLYILSNNNCVGLPLTIMNPVGKHRIVAGLGLVRIGCQSHDYKYWMDHIDEIGKANEYTKLEIKQVKDTLNWLHRCGKTGELP
jgi:hypothetical protein